MPEKWEVWDTSLLKELLPIIFGQPHPPPPIFMRSSGVLVPSKCPVHGPFVKNETGAALNSNHHQGTAQFTLCMEGTSCIDLWVIGTVC